MNKYSIILPVRNGGEYVKACINSILSQTFQDFNVVVLDNFSTDGTSEWLASLQLDKIVIIRADRPLSIEENWDRIKDISKNEFITLIGHDDVLYPDFLENINQLIDQYPAAGLYHTHFNFIDAHGKLIRKSKPMHSLLTVNELLKGFLTQTIDSMGTGYVMRATDYDAAGGIPGKYPNLLFADFELWLMLASKGGVAVSPNTCFAFRVHQSTTGTSQDYKLHNALELFVYFLAELKNKDKEKEALVLKHGNDLLSFYCKGFCHRLLRTTVEKRNGITVNIFIDQTKLLAKKLGIETIYHPEKIASVSIAKWIDSNKISRAAFLLFKKLYPKPVM